MDLLRRNRILTAGIIVLALLNIAVLATLWWQGTRAPVPRPGGPPGAASPGAFMERRLGLTDEQRSRFGEMRLRFRAEADPIERQMWTVRRALYDALRSGAAKDSFVVRVTDELGGLEAKMQRATFRHFQELRALCDSRQREELDALLRDVFARESGGLTPAGVPPPAGPGGEMPMPPGEGPAGGPPPGPPPR